jgi:hypothetical protein
VAVRPDGAIELLDEDEFQVHRKKYAYPEEVVFEARHAAAEVANLARDGLFPFNRG